MHRAICKHAVYVIAFDMNGNLKPKAEAGLLTCLFSWDLITSPAVWKTKELFVWHLVSP